MTEVVDTMRLIHSLLEEYETNDRVNRIGDGAEGPAAIGVEHAPVLDVGNGSFHRRTQ